MILMPNCKDLRTERLFLQGKENPHPWSTLLELLKQNVPFYQNAIDQKSQFKFIIFFKKQKCGGGFSSGEA